MRRKPLLSLLFTAALVMATALSAMGKIYEVGGKQLNVLGYISQGIQYSALGAAGDSHATEEGFNQALTTAFLELDYKMAPQLKLYGSGKIVADWIYDLKSDDDSWSDKEFSQSRSGMQFDDEWWQLFHEGHVTWSPGNFLFRVGKQIVSWGEMDFIQVMDQINPVDSRRGFSDLEFETTIIPIPLVRAEWWPDLSMLDTFLSELAFQLVINPNVDFIPNQGPDWSNKNSGIWSYSIVDGGLRAQYNESVEEPDEGDLDEWEFGARIQALIGSSIMTVTGFYGRANNPVTRQDLYGPTMGFGPSALAIIGMGPASDIEFDTEGNVLYEFDVVGYYPRQKFIGATLTTEVPQLSFSALGGSTPVIRAEVKYELDKTYSENFLAPLIDPVTFELIGENGFIQSDALETGLGIDWKIKCNFINPKGYLDTSFQVFYNKILDYPDELDYWNAGGSDHVHILDVLDQDWYAVSAYIQTLYMNAKLVPYVAWLFDISNEAHLLLTGLTYTPNNHWAFSMDYAFHHGEDSAQSFDAFEDKDYISAKIKYTF
jgi:Protein of unknown function (DUF1302)